MNIKNKKNIGLVFFVILLVQIFGFNYSASIYTGFVKNHENLKQSQIDMNTTLITDTIREQQKNTLSATKQSWMRYLEDNPDVRLIRQNDQGLPAYSNDKDTIFYNESIMYKENKGNNLFDIYDKKTNQLLIENSKPQWNTEEVEKILDMLVAPIKMFGNNGGIVVYDSNSGEVFLDTTFAQRLKNDNSASIFEDDKHPGNKNKVDTKYTVDNFFKFKKDSNRVSSIIYMFNESVEMGGEAGDFEKYPLGQYDRQFIELAILPYETIGFDGQPLQLTMLSVVDEKDVASAYVDIMDDLEESLEINKDLFGKTAVILFISILCTMTVMLFSLYKFKYKSIKDE